MFFEMALSNSLSDIGSSNEHEIALREKKQPLSSLSLCYHFGGMNGKVVVH